MLNVDFPILTRDGGMRHWSFSASSPGTLKDGRRFIIGMALDVTERKNADESLRLSEERLRLVLESATDYAIMLMETEGRFTTWNPGAEKICGFTEVEVVGRSAAIIFGPRLSENPNFPQKLGKALRDNPYPRFAPSRYTRPPPRITLPLQR